MTKVTAMPVCVVSGCKLVVVVACCRSCVTALPLYVVASLLLLHAVGPVVACCRSCVTSMPVCVVVCCKLVVACCRCCVISYNCNASLCCCMLQAC